MNANQGARSNGMPKARNRTANTHANVEQDLGDAALRACQVARVSSPCRVVFTHLRTRLADEDGLSGKAVLDGIVLAGVLPDDSTKQVSEVSHRQIKSRVEKTIITIETVGPVLSDADKRRFVS
jgi:hypothetical protein